MNSLHATKTVRQYQNKIPTNFPESKIPNHFSRHTFPKSQKYL